MTDVALPHVERHAFFTGERLFAETLDGAFAAPLELHRLHNRALHGWGVALGLEVHARRGARRVTVTAGYALDRAGRDLVLLAAAELEVPPVAAGPDRQPAPFALTIAFTDDADAEVESRGGACGTSGAVRRSDAPTLAFQAVGDVREGLDVVLAQVRVLDCALAGPPTHERRRSALGLARPYVSAGATPIGGTGWRPWPDDTQPAGMACHVDTSPAAFGDTPRYQARIEGPRAITFPFAGVVDGSLSVADPTPVGFEAIVVLPQGLTAEPTGAPLTINPDDVFADGFLQQLGWRVVWIGVEA
jgi:hypothetical protein